jgi:ferredoxin--NADP+ reductase
VQGSEKVSELGTEHNPLRVAVVGSGPSGFYAAEAIIKSGLKVRVDMLERLPSPFGLVRSGVAPDHPKLKQAILVYDKIAQSPEFNLLGNVTVGRDISVDELRASHHVVIFTSGAETDRRMGIPGEDLQGSYTATEFVGWYNGHPDYRDRQFDLSHEVAVVIGQGNVAADVCRILSKTVNELKTTDIAAHALEALAESKIRDIYMVGRRGPVQAKFTPIELKEFSELEDCDPVVSPADLILNPESETELADKTNANAQKNMETLRAYAARPASSKNRRCHFSFLLGPVRLEGKSRVERIVLEKNRLEGPAFNQAAKNTGEILTLDCNLVFRSIGYKGVAIAGVPFDDRKGVIPNKEGRIMDGGGNPIPGLYTAGWIKRGPSGIIGTNRACSVATVKSVTDDIASLDGNPKPGAQALYSLLKQRNVKVLNYADWRKIDEQEISRGKPSGKPREKFTRVTEMLSVLSM